MERIDLILHPVRFRVLGALSGETLTTAELAERLPDVPKSSIYRHLRALLDGGLIALAGERPVRGMVEKLYRLDQPPHLNAAAVSGLTTEQHAHYFRVFAMTLIEDFAAYIRAAGDGAALDMAADRAGYTQAFVFATSEELDHFGTALNEALRPLLDNPPNQEGRRKHKLAVITHPVGQE